MIGIALLTLVPGVVGGSETYARALTSALARVGTLEYEALLPPLAADAGGGLPSRIASGYPSARTTLGRLRAMAGGTFAPAGLCAELGFERLDAVHFPLTVRVPPSDGTPTVVTALDVQHLVHPGFFSPPERVYRRFAYDRSFRGARLVIAISEHVGRSLVERCGVDPERVRVVALGVDHARFRPGVAQREPFLLYPARRWPHKNHDRLLQAFALLRANRPELRLVLTGGGPAETPPQPGVVVRGHVSQDELVHLYQTASALVFPSLYEGFGLPVLEAMACGCPVAAATSGALPEICGDAARLFDPTSAEAIADAVDEVLDRPEPYVERGLVRAARFTWDACARGHEQVYVEAMGQA
jgi:glycosyltransferase involved in cell wall biosynthesis